MAESKAMQNRMGEGGELRIKKLRTSMIFGYSGIILFASILISVICIMQTKNALENQVSGLVSELSLQISLNLNRYISNMEDSNTMIFAEKTNYTYDATAENLDEYEAVETEKNIKNALYQLCIMDNYVDYFIVYANGHVVGKHSNGSSALFGNETYTIAASYITNEKTMDGWFTGYGEDYRRLYYVKRVNENALLVTSIYTTELGNVFVDSGNFQDIVIRIVDKNNRILFCSGDDENGTLLSEELSQVTNGLVNANINTKDSLISVVSGVNDWKIICELPSSSLQKEIQSIAVAIFMVTLIAVILSITLSVVFINKVTQPVQSMVGDLDKKATMDALTGIYNKKSFEEAVAEKIGLRKGKGGLALILFDLDNFKGVNDNLGHAFGDEVLAGVGEIMRANFRSSDLLGRLGGDEFAVLLDMSGLEEGDMRTLIEKRCGALCEAFHHYYTGEKKDYKVSASMGVSVLGADNASFEVMYKEADDALYIAKNSGKDTYRIYSGKENSHEA